MLGKYVVCFAIGVVTCYVEATGDSSSPVQLTCSSYGGICAEKGDCLEGFRENRGLCLDAKGRNRGLECCYGIPKSYTKCRQQGGECFDSSYRCSTATRANDCGEGMKCCILLN